MHERQQHPKQSRRATFALAAALAVTALTGGAAVTGLAQHSSPGGAKQVVQQASVVQQPATFAWQGDD